MPHTAASIRHSHAARSTRSALMSPAAVTRIGPSRSLVSAPFLKSSASLMKFVAI
jgi:hypothetical protein